MYKEKNKNVNSANQKIKTDVLLFYTCIDYLLYIKTIVYNFADFDFHSHRISAMCHMTYFQYYDFNGCVMSLFNHFPTVTHFNMFIFVQIYPQ